MEEFVLNLIIIVYNVTFTFCFGIYFFGLTFFTANEK